jgi:hypothetical protein
MAEFTFMEQQMLTQDLSDQQKVLFNGQFLSERRDRTLIFVVSQSLAISASTVSWWATLAGAS